MGAFLTGGKSLCQVRSRAAEGRKKCGELWSGLRKGNATGDFLLSIKDRLEMFLIKNERIERHNSDKMKISRELRIMTKWRQFFGHYSIEVSFIIFSLISLIIVIIE